MKHARGIPEQNRRPSGTSPAAFGTNAIIAVEVKQLDYDCYNRNGNQLFPIIKVTAKIEAFRNSEGRGAWRFQRWRGVTVAGRSSTT